MNTKEYKADYLKVSYWVDTPSYDHRNGNLGFDSEAESAAFLADCRRIFESGGWTFDKIYVRNGKSQLHLHPQMFLGIVHTELVELVPGLIEKATLFRSRGDEIHIRKPIYDITREQQREYLASKREEIEQDLLETFQTVRRNLYRILNNFWFDVSFPLGRKHGLDAMEDEVNNEAAKVISEVFNTLVASGKILQTEIRGNPAYRSLMKSDMPRERKKVIVSPETPSFL